jgi:polysaccharide export outer membrane protein
MALVAMLGLGMASCGCGLLHHGAIPEDHLPKEKNKVNHPDYVIEAPDILQIDALRVTPKPPYKIDSFDILEIIPNNVGPDWPTAGIAANPKLYFTVDPDGTVNLGVRFRTVEVVGKTLEEAGKAIEAKLKKLGLKMPEITVALAQSRGMQQIRGEHLVRPNGTISLGTYGDVPVSGLTLAEAKAVIEIRLETFLKKPEITVDVSGYNSKVYYLIIDLAGAGQQIFRMPVTGNETVLDAIGDFQVKGLPPFASKKKIWVARPGASDEEADLILPVDWAAITRGGSAKTNYQLFPGDRVFVKPDPLIATDNFLAKVFSPIERVLGIALLAKTTVHDYEKGGLSSSGTGGTGR